MKLVSFLLVLFLSFLINIKSQTYGNRNPSSDHSSMFSLSNALDDDRDSFLDHAIHDDDHAFQISSFLEGPKMNIFSLEYLRKDPAVAAVCRMFGCKNGVKHSGKRLGECYEKLRCAQCRRRSKGETSRGFCPSLPLRNLIILAQGSIEDVGEEEDVGEWKQPGRGQRFASDDEDSMGMDDDEEEEEDPRRQFVRRGFLELESDVEMKQWMNPIHYESFLSQDWSEEGESSEGESSEGEYEDSFQQNTVKTLRFKPVLQSQKEHFNKCDQNVHGGSIILRIDLFFTQITDPSFTANSPQIQLEASFTGTGMEKEECGTPAVYRNNIKRTQLLQITLNIPVSKNEFEQWLNEGFAGAIRNRLHVSITCKSAKGCRSSVYLSCVKVSCSPSPAWKQQQAKRLESIAAEQKLLHEKATAEALKIKETLEQERRNQIAEQKKLREQLLAQRKAQEDANKAAWDKYHKDQKAALDLYNKALAERQKQIQEAKDAEEKARADREKANRPAAVVSPIVVREEPPKKAMPVLSVLPPPTSREVAHALEVKGAVPVRRPTTRTNQEIMVH